MSPLPSTESTSPAGRPDLLVLGICPDGARFPELLFSFINKASYVQQVKKVSHNRRPWNLIVATLFLGLIFWSQFSYAQNKRQPQDWWLANIGNSGAGPYGASKTVSGNCESCLIKSGVWHRPAWTGVTTQYGTFDMKYRQGCQFYVNGGGIENGGCVVTRMFVCPSGYRQDGSYCVLAGKDPDKNKGCSPGCMEGNPINVGAGNKFQRELDYDGVGSFPLTFHRFYNSFGSAPGNIMHVVGSAGTWGPEFYVPGGIEGFDNYVVTVQGKSSNARIDKGWRHSYDSSLITSDSANLSIASIIRPDASVVTFTKVNQLWVADTSELPTRLTRLTDSNGNFNGWEYVNASDETETYDESGRLKTIKSRRGLQQLLEYDADGRLSRVSDPAGRSLVFSYNESSQLQTLMDPAGRTYTYSYDSLGNLSGVAYPDGSSRSYLYEDSRFSHALTGIVDENGKRYSTWQYDVAGNAVSSEHAGGVDQLSITYSTPQTQVAAVNGATRTYDFVLKNGAAKLAKLTEVCGVNCQRVRSLTYTADGSVESVTDWNGWQTKYWYDSATKMEIKREEGVGSPVARTITTEWHPHYRLPARLAEPRRITTFVYDPVGNLLSKTVQATSDSNGAAGFVATTVGAPRQWTYTYYPSGLLKTSTSPRADVSATTSYGYNSQSDLVTVTNALNHQWIYSNFDADGRPGRITEPNGIHTDLIFSARGWLISSTSGGEVTSYERDGVGQLKQLTRPDGSKINYTYNDAQQLTGISDNLGNSIRYALDLSGNRVAEQVRDPAGTLTRQTTRVYDLLNRVQQVSGAQQ